MPRATSSERLKHFMNACTDGYGGKRTPYDVTYVPDAGSDGDDYGDGDYY